MMTVMGNIGGVASQSLFTDLSPKMHRGRIVALSTVIGATQSYNILMAGSGAIIGAAGNLVGGFLYHEGTYELPLLLSTGVLGLTALIALFFVKEPSYNEKEL